MVALTGHPTAAAPADVAGARHTTYVLALLAIAMLLWLPALTSSFWVDETITYWIVKDGLGEAMQRVLRFYSVPPLYFVIAWAAGSLGGASELAFRWPSTIAVGLTVFLLYRLGCLLIDRQAALAAAIVFACSRPVAFFAADARPYGLALLAAVGSMLALVRWNESGRTRDAVLYVLCASAAIHLHYLLGTMLLVHAAYVADCRRRGATRVSLRAIGMAAVAIVVLAAPLTPHLLATAKRSGILAFARPSLAALKIVLLPPAVVLAVYAVHRIRPRWISAPSAPVPFLLAWSILPALAVMLVSWTTPLHIFAVRYFAHAEPGWALLVGWALASLTSATTRRLILSARVAAAALAVISAHATHAPQDWRGAARFVRSLPAMADAPVLIRAGVIEAEQNSWLTNPEVREYLTAPTTYYRVPNKVVPLPFRKASVSIPYLEQLATMMLDECRFIVLNKIDQSGPSSERTRIAFPEWFEARLAPAGFSSTRLADFGIVAVVVFERALRGPEQAACSRLPDSAHR